MKKHRAARILSILAIVVAAVAVFGYIVMRLWNGLMPALFGLHAVSFWQAVGLLILARILFVGPPAGLRRRGGFWRHRMKQRWEQMTPEEREQFRAAVRARCGGGAEGNGPATPAAPVG